jgi:hypothetical protein
VPYVLYRFGIRPTSRHRASDVALWVHLIATKRHWLPVAGLATGTRDACVNCCADLSDLTGLPRRWTRGGGNNEATSTGRAAYRGRCDKSHTCLTALRTQPLMTIVRFSSWTRATGRRYPRDKPSSPLTATRHPRTAAASRTPLVSCSRAERSTRTGTKSRIGRPSNSRWTARTTSVTRWAGSCGNSALNRAVMPSKARCSSSVRTRSLLHSQLRIGGPKSLWLSPSQRSASPNGGRLCQRSSFIPPATERVVLA